MKLNELGASRGLSGIAPDQEDRDRRDRDVHDLIEDVRGLHGAERERAVSIAMRALLPLFDRWSYLAARSNGDYDMTYREDIVSVAAMEAFRMLSPDGMLGRAPQSWIPYMRRMMQNRVATFYTSGQANQLSGTVMIHRRKKTIARFTAELRLLMDREPTQDEIIEYANDMLSHSRKDAEGQGAIITPDDFIDTPRTVHVDVEIDGDVEDSRSSDGDQSLIHRVEGEAMVLMIVEACRALSDEHAKVAHLWIGGLYSGEAIRSTEEITREMGLKPRESSAVDRILADVRETARTISAEKFGLSFPV